MMGAIATSLVSGCGGSEPTLVFQVPAGVNPADITPGKPSKPPRYRNTSGLPGPPPSPPPIR